MDIILCMYYSGFSAKETYNRLKKSKINITLAQVEQVYKQYDGDLLCKCHVCTSGQVSKYGRLEKNQ